MGYMLEKEFWSSPRRLLADMLFFLLSILFSSIICVDFIKLYLNVYYLSNMLYLNKICFLFLREALASAPHHADRAGRVQPTVVRGF